MSGKVFSKSFASASPASTLSGDSTTSVRVAWCYARAIPDANLHIQPKRKRVDSTDADYSDLSDLDADIEATAKKVVASKKARAAVGTRRR